MKIEFNEKITKNMSKVQAMSKIQAMITLIDYYPIISIIKNVIEVKYDRQFLQVWLTEESRKSISEYLAKKKKRPQEFLINPILYEMSLLNDAGINPIKVLDEIDVMLFEKNSDDEIENDIICRELETPFQLDDVIKKLDFFLHITKSTPEDQWMIGEYILLYYRADLLDTSKSFLMVSQKINDKYSMPIGYNGPMSLLTKIEKRVGLSYRIGKDRVYFIVEMIKGRTTNGSIYAYPAITFIDVV